MAFNRKTGSIFDTVGRLEAADGKTFKTAATARFPSMTAIDKAVRIPAMRAAVWEHFGFEQHVVYPVLSGDLLYGTLSNVVHNTGTARRGQGPGHKRWCGTPLNGSSGGSLVGGAVSDTARREQGQSHQ